MRKIYFSAFVVCLIVATQAHMRPAIAQQAEGVTVLEAVPPIYSQVAVNARASGKLSVEVEINSDGSVASAHAVQPSIFRPAAEKAALRWRFVPSTDARLRVVKLLFHFIIVNQVVEASDLVPIFTPPYEIEIRGVPSDAR
jgi:hypothetical protein